MIKLNKKNIFILSFIFLIIILGILYLYKINQKPYTLQQYWKNNHLSDDFTEENIRNSLKLIDNKYRQLINILYMNN